MLVVAWRTPRYDADQTGRPAPAWLARIVDSRPWFVALAGRSACWSSSTPRWSRSFGKDRLTNPFFGIFYVCCGSGFVPASLLFGPVWKAISPMRTINAAFAKLTGGDPEQGVFVYPERLGYWPAAVGLYRSCGWSWSTRSPPSSGPVRLWCAMYVAAMLLGGALFGNTFYEHADPFEVYSTLVARLSVWGRRGRALVVRSPLANLDTTPVRPGLVARHRGAVREHGVRLLQGLDAMGEVHPGRLRDRARLATTVHNLGLLGFCSRVALIFAVGTMLTGVGPGPAATRAAQPVRALDHPDRGRATSSPTT